MNSKHQKRLLVSISLLVGVALVIGLVLLALSQNINLFYTPTEIQAAQLAEGRAVRLGGMVVPGSVEKSEGLLTHFVLTDYASQVSVSYDGLLPDLFREGQGIVATGIYAEQHFTALSVLAKHDEKYEPPEIQKIQKKGGR